MTGSMISVIVPVFKVEQYLDECVASIVNQTYRDLEIILVDDGSPDNCPQMCDAWAEKDSRIRVIHKRNGGAAAARNAGLDIAKGQYIGFVDSDDYIREDMYEVLLHALQGSQKKMSCCHMERGSQGGRLVEQETERIWELDIEETLNEMFHFRVGTSLWRRLFERSVWEQIRLPEGEINEEYPVLIPLTVASDGMVHVSHKLYFYRDTENSVTSSTWKSDCSVVLKNLMIMRGQMDTYGLKCTDSFRSFETRSALSIAVSLDKHYHLINDNAKENYGEYLSIVQKNFWRYMFDIVSIKSKVFCILVAAGLLRPIYKMLGKIK